MSKKKPKSKQDAEPNFEACLQELAEIVARLESGELTLDKSLEQYELGVRRLKACYRHLNAAERRIEIVSGVDAEGRPTTEPFEASTDEDSLHDSAARSRKRSASRKRSRSASTTESDESSSLF